MDENQRISLELARLQLRDATPREKALQVEHEASSIPENSISDNDLEVTQADVLESIELERKLAKRLSDGLEPAHEVLLQKIVGGEFIDLLIRGQKMYAKDYIIDVRYRPRGFTYGWLKKAALQIRQTSGRYSQFENRYVDVFATS